MRAIVLALLLLAAGQAAAQKRYESGGMAFSVGPAPAYVVARNVPSAWDRDAPGATGAPWRFWLSDTQVDRRGGHHAAWFDIAYEAVAASMLGDAGKLELRFYPAYQSLTIHRIQVRRDGVWHDRLDPASISLVRREREFERDTTDGEAAALVVLKDIRVGDVVRASYSVEGSNPILAGQLAEWTRFNWSSPMLDSWLRVIDDPGVPLKAYRENGAPEAVASELPDRSELVMHGHGWAAVVDEGNYPPGYQPFALGSIGTMQSWGDVVRWGRALYPVFEGRFPADLEAGLAEWAALPDPVARTTAALRAVQDQVRYFGIEIGASTHRPASPPETWERRYGDCKDKAYLLVSILARLGIKAAPALVSTVRGPALTRMLPSASVFNHVIVRARIGDRDVWMDPTMTQQGGDPGEYDLSDYGAALVLAPGSESLQSIAPARPAVEPGISAIETFSPEAKGRRVAFTVATTYTGWAADMQRHRFATQGVEEVARQYADYYRKRYGELVVSAPPVVEDDRAGNNLKVTERYILADPFKTVVGAARKLEVAGETLRPWAALPATVSRKGPLRVGEAPASYHQETVVNLPPGWRADGPSLHYMHGSAAFDFASSVGADAASLKAVFDLEVKRPTLDAAPDIAEHVAQLREVQDALVFQLQMTTAGGNDRSDRERRLQELLRGVMKEGVP
jgi:hypothetical protein